MHSFPAHYPDILQLLSGIQPQQYARTRNFTNGAVTRLSPYLSRGVISTRMVMQYLAEAGYTYAACEKLLQELAWRDYYQRVWQVLGPNISSDIRRPQERVHTNLLPAGLESASTGIEAIDAAIRELYDTGYMHNHCRMYTAALACHAAQAHWLQPARWMYYHLLDGDWASNSLSWQWVAGTFSNKIYIANQENINNYTGSTQRGTFLDVPYEQLPPKEIPSSLQQCIPFEGKTKLPTQQSELNINPDLPVLLYDYYNMDPAWLSGMKANRVLLLEPKVFEAYPISEHCMQFLLQLTHNLPQVQIFCGSFQDLQAAAKGAELHYKEHPLTAHYQGTIHPRDWMVPEVQGFHPSFFAYWKKIQGRIQSQFSS
jgi:deoxyribodipyrimidine photo-lyase